MCKNIHIYVLIHIHISVHYLSIHPPTTLSIINHPWSLTKIHLFTCLRWWDSQAADSPVQVCPKSQSCSLCGFRQCICHGCWQEGGGGGSGLQSQLDHSDIWMFRMVETVGGFPPPDSPFLNSHLGSFHTRVQEKHIPTVDGRADNCSRLGGSQTLRVTVQKSQDPNVHPSPSPGLIHPLFQRQLLTSLLLSIPYGTRHCWPNTHCPVGCQLVWLQLGIATKVKYTNKPQPAIPPLSKYPAGMCTQIRPDMTMLEYPRKLIVTHS